MDSKETKIVTGPCEFFVLELMKVWWKLIRVQRLEKINNKKAEVSTRSTNIGTLLVTETSAFSTSNVSQQSNNVNSDNIIYY